MEVSSVLTMSIVIIILMLFIVFSMELLIPIQLKFEMNGVCRGYIYKIEANGQLTESEENDLEASLMAIGLSNPVIDIVSEGNQYGDKVMVTITCEYNHNRIVDMFNRRDSQLILNYKRSYFVRKIKN